MAQKELSQQLISFFIGQIDKRPSIKDELRWFIQDPGLLQFFDALRFIGESDNKPESVYELGRLAAKTMIPEAPERPDLVIEMGTRKLESLIGGYRAAIRRLGQNRAEIVTWFEDEVVVSGWAFCKFVEGWFVGVMEQANCKNVLSTKASCTFTRGRFLYSDGELRAGSEREVIFYPKGSYFPKIVDKRGSQGQFKYRQTRFGERFCTYKLSWRGSLKNFLAVHKLKGQRKKEREMFSLIVDKVEKDSERYRNGWDHVMGFRESLLEFIRASGTITSSNELWDAISRCAHDSIGFERIAVFEVKASELELIYYWDVDKQLANMQLVLKMDQKSPEAVALGEGRGVVVEGLDQTVGASPVFSQKWFSPGYIVVPMGEPPDYEYIVWGDMYKKKRPPDALETTEMNILVFAASMALTKLGSVEKLEERIQERTQTLRELTVRLNALYQEVKESEVIKSQFLSVVGHELRTPLGSILGLAQVLLKGMDGPLTSEQKKDLEAILKSSEHLLGLINDILDLSRLESKRLKLEPRLVDISEMLREVVKIVEPQAREKGLTFITSIPDDIKAEVDQRRITQVVTNLCTNAMKFTEEGEVRLELKEKGSEVTITVEDTGSGIPKEYHEKIFDPFFQMEERRTSGLGLGLAIAKRLVELHDGTIEVQDSEKGGAKFIVTLPRGQSEAG